MSKQIGTSTKKSRGLGRNTLQLRDDIMTMIAEQNIEPPFTVRQAYYKLVTLNAIGKEQSEYRRVQRELLRLRREGEVRYDHITDTSRLRRHYKTYFGLDDVLQQTARLYRQDLWRDTDVYVEVWCEKDALAGVIDPITRMYDVPLLTAKGYSSEGFCYEASVEMKAVGASENYVYCLGDFDPSGIDATDTLREKMKRFKPDVHFERLAVNEDQLDELEHAKRKTKKTDTRTKRFFEKYGQDAPSVELDAIDPTTLRALIRDKIEQHIPAGGLEARDTEERLARETLMQIAENWAA